MSFEDTFFLSDKLAPVPEADLTDLADWFRRVAGSPLPTGYGEYLTTFGDGTYCDNVGVYRPTQIMNRLGEARALWADHFFWTAGADVLTKQDVLRSVPVAGTLDGDEIIFCPDHPRHLFVLPRHDQAIYRMPEGLFDPISWYPQSRGRIPPFRYFVTSRDRAVVEMFTAEQTFDAGTLADQLMRRWTSREVRDIRQPRAVFVFAKAIGGRVQLTQGPVGEDRRVGIRIDYDHDSGTEVNAVVRELVGEGFYETWRHAG